MLYFKEESSIERKHVCILEAAFKRELRLSCNDRIRKIKQNATQRIPQKLSDFASFLSFVVCVFPRFFACVLRYQHIHKLMLLFANICTQYTFSSIFIVLVADWANSSSSTYESRTFIPVDQLLLSPRRNQLDF